MDMMFINHYLGVMPKNIYCTKIASRLCRTYTQKHSLLDVVQELCDTTLEKETQTSDWSVEHLTEDQIKYATNDVLYLHKVRDELNLKIKFRGNDLDKLTKKCFEFLETRVYLDLLDYEGPLFDHH
jgi:ribonuclease D